MKRFCRWLWSMLCHQAPPEAHVTSRRGEIEDLEQRAQRAMRNFDAEVNMIRRRERT